MFTREEIMTMATKIDNLQDGVILALIFDGLSSKNGFRELIELKKNHVDFDNNVIHVTAGMLNQETTHPRQVPN